MKYSACKNVDMHDAKGQGVRVIKGDKEHRDDMGRELCDNSGHGVL